MEEIILGSIVAWFISKALNKKEKEITTAQQPRIPARGSRNGDPYAAVKGKASTEGNSGGGTSAGGNSGGGNSGGNLIRIV